MFERLVYLLIASGWLTARIFLVLHFYFSDIVAVASSEVPQSLWRFEAAFVLTSLAWIAFVVAFLTATALLVLLVKRRRAG